MEGAGQSRSVCEHCLTSHFLRTRDSLHVFAKKIVARMLLVAPGLTSNKKLQGAKGIIATSNKGHYYYPNFMHMGSSMQSGQSKSNTKMNKSNRQEGAWNSFHMP